MVRGLHSEILMKDSKFIGFNLGTDYSYVHENGFDGIIKMFQSIVTWYNRFKAT